MAISRFSSIIKLSKCYQIDTGGKNVRLDQKKQCIRLLQDDRCRRTLCYNVLDLILQCRPRNMLHCRPGPMQAILHVGLGIVYNVRA